MADGNNDFKIQVTFEVPSGFMYSVRRSDQISDESFGMNLVDISPSYAHNEREFTIYNASDIQIDPYYQRHDLKISMAIDESITITNKRTAHIGRIRAICREKQKWSLMG
ncbi:Phage tail protein [Weissella viridescens]|uniref:Phage tail protein n=1 Tax=Weissella viridescens TaxID=1629 RepID=A0A380P9B0_WEIVI|nr:Phage tail protein [Weissella viridescens]